MAPEQVVRASIISTEEGEGWVRRVCARVAPVMPEPMMRKDTFLGRSGVVRWLEIGAGGSCHCDTEGFGAGSPGGMEARCSMMKNYKQRTNYEFSGEV